MRELTIEELEFVSGGETVIVTAHRRDDLTIFMWQQFWTQQAQFNSAIENQARIMGMQLNLEDGCFEEVIFRLQPPGLSGAVQGALQAVGGALLMAYSDGTITPQEWTVAFVAGALGAGMGALGVSVDATLTSTLARIVWGVGVNLAAGASGALITS
ncbi:hypothetical protein [Candidatus Phycosocius spiralis]|uniref:Uncharacterized protein n=1 Tax=Candidatus Phycosocius spiralis TaxID=2815099 RepID=A0ABQ4PU89_9PROT|nr:hypothetical protein [Candidatus Phycosocius spiralis]GIU66548.1 hypothetical protein PsB1_0702 [Candidatus Phycosocius spiralis]